MAVSLAKMQESRHLALERMGKYVTPALLHSLNVNRQAAIQDPRVQAPPPKPVFQNLQLKTKLGDKSEVYAFVVKRNGTQSISAQTREFS